MALLNAADALYLGAQPIDRVYLGATQVWPAALPPEFVLGDDGANGGGNWPVSGDRGLFCPFLLAAPATLVSFNMRTRAASGGGCRFRGVVYAADGAGAAVGGVARPGTRLAMTDPSAVVAAGAQLVTLPIAGTLPAGWIWIGYTADSSGAGSGAETDSGGTNPGRTIMFNGGMSFASPANPAPAWPGSPGPYSNTPATWLVCR